MSKAVIYVVSMLSADGDRVAWLADDWTDVLVSDQIWRQKLFLDREAAQEALDASRDALEALGWVELSVEPKKL